MADCIICGTSSDGPVCDTHQEDVVFEFRGEHPNQLTEGRFYRGSVDGYAEFGVFIDLSEHVTGLLHRSKLDRRLESLDWEVGDAVYVQVTNVRDNGDIDLGWSIRQSDREFRGTLIDAPDGDRLAEPEDAPESGSRPEPEPEHDAEPEPEPTADADAEPEPEAEPDTESQPEPAPEPESASEPASTDGEPERVNVESLRERVGETVRLEGEVVSVRQTSGPTVFELRDETGVVDCAAFEEAGVRAYPEVEVGDIARLDGEIRVRRDEIQVETEALEVLEGDELATVADRMDEALRSASDAGDVEPIAEDAAVEALDEDVRVAATAIRRAIKESRPIVVRHSADTDGYVAGAAIERAVLPLVREEHAGTDAVYHYFDRRPLEGTVYDLDDATKDVTRMLDDRERHDEKLPLFVFAGAGGTRDSLDGLELLGIYGAERLVIDGLPVEEAVVETAETTLGPETGEARTATTLAATVAVGVNDAVREDLEALPAISYWDDVPEVYADLAVDAGLEADVVRDLREAVALEAYYQSYEDKRELIIDLLFDRVTGLAEQVAEQFRTKLETELETATANLDRREVGGVEFVVLDTDAYTHRFDFPPTRLLLDELHRREVADGDGPTVTIGLAMDELHLRSTTDVGVREVARAVRERVPEGGVDTKGTREGTVEFLSGERDAVLDATMAVVAERLSATSEA
ncbi:MAG: OB-fold nucleic acid binding domain-containing protein [Haloarculaceae archaeon]